jgi:hypothetical protein
MAEEESVVSSECHCDMALGRSTELCLTVAIVKKQACVDIVYTKLLC